MTVGRELLLLSAALFAVRQVSGQTEGRAGADALSHYRLDAPPDWSATLPPGLAEVSGLASTRSGMLLAHGDERAEIWEWNPDERRARAHFGLRGPVRLLRGDFEDIALVGERLFLVTGSGEIFEGRVAPDGKTGPAVRRSRGLGQACEAEGMAWDPPTRSLLILCKTARTERWNHHLIILAISTETWRFEREPRLVVPAAALERATGKEHFHGSAMARHPRTGTYLVIAGPERTFVELSASGAVLGGGRLDRDHHRQPEAIVVGPDLTLFIGDEAAGHTARITAYAYRP
jgi:hypothetical protein